MHTFHVPNSSKATNRVPEPVSRTEANCEPCDYDTNPENIALQSKNNPLDIYRSFSEKINLSLLQFIICSR